MRASTSFAILGLAAIASAVAAPVDETRFTRVARAPNDTSADKPVCIDFVPVNTGDKRAKRDCTLVHVNATPVTAKNETVAGQPLKRNETSAGILAQRKRTLACAEFSGVNINNEQIARQKREACEYDVNTTAFTADDTVVKGPKVPAAKREATGVTGATITGNDIEVKKPDTDTSSTNGLLVEGSKVVVG